MPAQSVQILLIEDSPSDAALIQSRLESVTEFKFQVDHAIRLEDGISKLSANTYDALLLDLNLPDSSGLDTVRRARAASSSVPLIVLTGLDDRELLSEAIESGANSYLVKDNSDGNRLAVGILWAMRNHTN